MTDHELILRSLIHGWGVLCREPMGDRITLKFNSSLGPSHVWFLPSDLSLTEKRREALNKLLASRLYDDDVQAAIESCRDAGG